MSMLSRYLVSLLFCMSCYGSVQAKEEYCSSPPCIEFPKDAGALNVKDFGAKGDGVTDDTASINAALSASGNDMGEKFWQDKIVYLPRGTYLVSDTIAKRYESGRYGSGSILIGHSKADTVIQLKDHAKGFADPEKPRAVLFTTAKLLDGDPTSGGKDYINKGEGNDAFENYIENMTIDVGAGNAGAIGIDYLANNMGAVRHVEVRDRNRAGLTGISLTRKWPGPAFLHDVSISGFETGIAVSQTEYGITMEHIRLLGQRKTAFINSHNVVSLRDILIEDAPTAMMNLSHDGLIIIDGGQFRGTSQNISTAITNEGYMNLRRLSIEGYKTVFAAEINSKMYDGIYEQNHRLFNAQPSWSLPISDPPETHYEPVKLWINVEHYGAKADSPTVDSADAIQEAMNAGGKTVYFSHGTYYIGKNITVPASVERIVGMMSAIHSYGQDDNLERAQGMFRVKNHKKPLAIEHLTFDNSYLGNQVGVEALGKQPLLMQDIAGQGVVTLKRSAEAGKVYIEGTCCGTIEIEGKKPVFARQLNTEGGGVRIKNNGAPLSILGLKTEGECTILDNMNGATTEVLGGLIYMVNPAEHPKMPAFRNTDSKLLLSYVEEAYNPKSLYMIHVENVRGKTRNLIMGQSLPQRNKARMVPQWSSDN